MKRLFEFVEIKTKITSVSPFLLSLALLFFLRVPIKWFVTAVFFVSMFLLDLATTAINNYIDSSKNGQSLPYTRPTAKGLIFLLLFFCAASGLLLVLYTDAIVLLTGGLCFVCGVLYTYGPVPISSTPLGEAISGIFYGFFIPFLILYINLPSGTLFSLAVGMQFVDLHINVFPMLRLLLICAIPTFLTANIMLANNICDVKKDIAIGRHTLPYYLGHYALYLFAALYYGCYAAIAALSLLGAISPVCLLLLLTIWPVQRNINRFFREQDKAKTFIVSIWNYGIIMGTVILLVFLGRYIG